MSDKLYIVLRQFLLDVNAYNCRPLSVGLINESYIVSKGLEPLYLLQMVNSRVFPKIVPLMNNAELVKNHIINDTLGGVGNNILPIEFLMTFDKELFHTDEQGNYWRLMKYIPHTLVDEGDSDVELAKEAASILARFHTVTRTLSTDCIDIVIDHFHQVDYYYNRLISVMNHTNQRLIETEDISNKIKSYSFLLDHYTSVKDNLPIRIAHNDPKLSNILFDQNRKAISIIDWDTIMPGFICNDFGDAIRSFCNTADEDEMDMTKVKFDINIYRAYISSYLDTISNVISSIEKENLAYFALIITFEQAIRFYIDYLEGDLYYKIEYPTHNLDRTNVQLKLLDSMNNQFNEMQQLILR